VDVVPPVDGADVGVDTWRLLFCTSLPSPFVAPRGCFELVDGYRGQWFPGLSLLAVEGHPAGAGNLCPPSRLPEAAERLSTSLRELGYLRSRHDRCEGFSRVDATSTVRVDERAGRAAMRALSRLDVPRCDTVARGGGGRTPHSIAWVASNGRRILGRAYDKQRELQRRGAGIEGAQRFELVRLEDQRRHPKARRPRDVDELAGPQLRRDFEQRFATLGVAGRVDVVHMDNARARVVELVDAGELGPRRAQTLLGYLNLRDVGLDERLPRRTQERQRAGLRELGLCTGAVDERTTSNLRDLYAAALDSERWAA